jgi:hypothetical protein
MFVVDLVHREFFAEFLKSHVVPFAERFSAAVLRHPTELATGEAFVNRMRASRDEPIETRLRPRVLKARVKRGRLIARNVLSLLCGGRGNEDS